ncbi:orotidine-5'-phosphate decarboxylase [Hazenella sp. IB182353]|uniref:orotidine-5'-phosphate decarboxylase n=1 Tax=Polycladospora coralii TaxID=2771432 RepID=UPI0017468F8A|nr:orotidine-5'-phosphate decarboxylase [Polycladospora coralii]MBS7530319.1 orotidine-5'-phosphate decarboxylase [Polycladospora coralii]
MVDPRVFIALDYPSIHEVEQLLAHWQHQQKPAIKIGYQLFYQLGPDWVKQKKKEGYTIFLDLKLHDIPNTVANGVKSLLQLGVDFLTLHASGGAAMIEAARSTVEKHQTKGNQMKLLAVTHLTSMSDQMLHTELGVTESLTENVVRLAQLAHQSGTDGVICSGQEVIEIKHATHPDFLAVTPGIRPHGVDASDQQRVVTPATAIQNGADYIVVGRAITHTKQPIEAYQQICAEIQS